MRFSKSVAAVALATLPSTLAQTFTDCNPLEKTCPADTGLDASTFSSDFTKGSSAFSSWSAADGTTLSYGSKGAEFVISKDGQAPTISSDFYFLFGTLEVVMQAAPGTGIVSSIVLESDDLDEIDWEFLGGDTTEVETNYFGKGNTSTYDRAIYYPVSSPQTTMHTYTIDWSSSAVVFSIDGKAVRTLHYADANGGSNFPQTPMRVKLGNWAGGAPGQPAGTVQWAGGATDFTKAPFTMYVQSVKLTNSNPAKEYLYGDKTGSWQSIKIDGSSSATGGSSSSGGSSSGSSGSTSSAPTSSLKVAQLQKTEAAVSSTRTGSASTWTTATATAGAYGSAATYGAGNLTHSTNCTNSTSLHGAGSGSRLSNSSTYSLPSSTASSGPAQQTTSGASVTTATTALVAVLGLAMSFWAL